VCGGGMVVFVYLCVVVFGGYGLVGFWVGGVEWLDVDYGV